jgi:hypothetical protein
MLQEDDRRQQGECRENIEISQTPEWQNGRHQHEQQSERSEARRLEGQSAAVWHSLVDEPVPVLGMALLVKREFRHDL